MSESNIMFGRPKKSKKITSKHVPMEVSIKMYMKDPLRPNVPGKWVSIPGLVDTRMEIAQHWYRRLAMERLVKLVVIHGIQTCVRVCYKGQAPKWFSKVIHYTTSDKEFNDYWGKAKRIIACMKLFDKKYAGFLLTERSLQHTTDINKLEFRSVEDLASECRYRDDMFNSVWDLLGLVEKSLGDKSPINTAELDEHMLCTGIFEMMKNLINAFLQGDESAISAVMKSYGLNDRSIGAFSAMEALLMSYYTGKYDTGAKQAPLRSLKVSKLPTAIRRISRKISAPEPVTPEPLSEPTVPWRPTQFPEPVVRTRQDSLTADKDGILYDKAGNIVHPRDVHPDTMVTTHDGKRMPFSRFLAWLSTLIGSINKGMHNISNNITHAAPISSIRNAISRITSKVKKPAAKPLSVDDDDDGDTLEKILADAKDLQRRTDFGSAWSATTTPMVGFVKPYRISAMESYTGMTPRAYRKHIMSKTGSPNGPSNTPLAKANDYYGSYRLGEKINPTAAFGLKGDASKAMKLKHSKKVSKKSPKKTTKKTTKKTSEFGNFFF